MLKDIMEVRPQENHQLYLKFEDGKDGIIDVSSLVEFTGMFAPLNNLDYFQTVKVNPELGTIYGKNGADLDRTKKTVENRNSFYLDIGLTNKGILISLIDK